MLTGFIERHGLHDAGQREAAAHALERVERSGVRFVRLAWVDTYGASRAKLITAEAFASALRIGHNILVATYTLDASGARVFASFTKGGGLGIEELTGSPNLIVVPDPATFRILPWDDGAATGWVLCDTYFTNGKPFPFCPRQLLKRQLARLTQRGWNMTVGLELEWYLSKVVSGDIEPEHVGSPGLRPRPIDVRPPEPGYQLHGETSLDLIQPMLMRLAEAYEKLGLPLRSIENEWGPGQVECTFAPLDALAAADTMLLLRSATRQICRRHGHLASFMTRPAIKGYVASGWHLHQTLTDVSTGANVFAPAQGAGDALTPLGRSYLAGLLAHANAGAPFSTPTVNGYRRLRAYSLAPDRASWAVDHRGVMVRVLGGPGDPATRLENRIGEPMANPYHFIAQQVAAGLAGIDTRADPGPPAVESYAADRPPLPRNLAAALDALQASPVYAEALGAAFIDYYIKMKRSEVSRFEAYLKDNGIDAGDEPTAWEHNEYFDFF